MANTEKKWLAIWSVASGEDSCGSRYYGWMERTVLSFLLRSERMDETEMPQVLCKLPFRVTRDVQASSLRKGWRIFNRILLIKWR